MTQTVRVPRLVPSRIFDAVSSARFRVRSIQRVPVSRSKTGQGLPMVSGPASATTRRGDHVAPPSTLRFNTRSISPLSPPPSFRPSQKARTVPPGETINEGMRKV